jgi:peroxiredoxin
LAQRTLWLSALILAAAWATAADETAWPPLVDIQGHRHHPLQEPDIRALVMITVMADCPIVNSYAPEYNRLMEDYRQRGVQIFLLQVDPHATLESLQEHARRYDLKLPVIHDADHAWVSRLGATRTPEATVLGPNGKVRYRGRIDDLYFDIGKRRAAATTRDLRDAIEAILDDRPIAHPRTTALGCYIPKLPNRGESP